MGFNWAASLTVTFTPLKKVEHFKYLHWGGIYSGFFKNNFMYLRDWGFDGAMLPVVGLVVG